MPFGLKNPFSKPTAPDAGAAMSDGGITAEDDWESPVPRVVDGTPGPLAAHEAAHTVQQRDSSGAAASVDEPDSPLDSAEVVSPRDQASGLATGRAFTVDAQGPTVDVTSPRDVASGQGTGRLDPDDDGDGFADITSSQDTGLETMEKRQHNPVRFEKATDDNPDGATDFAAGPRQTTSMDGSFATTDEVTTAREAGSGMATGRIATGDVTGDGVDEAVSPRDAASGLATGRRSEQVDSPPEDETVDLDTASERQKAWLPSNFREGGAPVDPDTDGDGVAFEYDVKAPRDVATGQASGRMAETGGVTDGVDSPEDARISTNMTIERQTPKRDFGDRMPSDDTTDADSVATVSNAEGSRGVVTGVTPGVTNIGSSGNDGVRLADDLDDDGPSTLLDLSGASESGGAVVIADLDGDAMPDMADLDSDGDAIEADDLMANT